MRHMRMMNGREGTEPRVAIDPFFSRTSHRHMHADRLKHEVGYITRTATKQPENPGTLSEDTPPHISTCCAPPMSLTILAFPCPDTLTLPSLSKLLMTSLSSCASIETLLCASSWRTKSAYLRPFDEAVGVERRTTSSRRRSPRSLRWWVDWPPRRSRSIRPVRGSVADSLSASRIRRFASVTSSTCVRKHQFAGLGTMPAQRRTSTFSE